jgi:large subunit ribosomal protein L24
MTTTYNRIRHLKKGDKVVALWGSFAGKSGEVLEVSHKTGRIKVEGLGLVKRHEKPSQQNPKGGINEKNAWLPASKFQVSDGSGKAQGRVGFSVSKDGKKERVFGKARKK